MPRSPLEASDRSAKRHKVENAVVTNPNLNVKYQVALRRIIELEKQTDPAVGASASEVLLEDLIAARLQQMKEGKHIPEKKAAKKRSRVLAQAADPTQAMVLERTPSAPVEAAEDDRMSSPSPCSSASSTICATTNTDTTKVVRRIVTASELDEQAILSLARLIS